MRVRNQRLSLAVALLSAAAVLYMGTALPLFAQSANSGTGCRRCHRRERRSCEWRNGQPYRHFHQYFALSNTNGCWTDTSLWMSAPVFTTSLLLSRAFPRSRPDSVKVGVATTANLSLQVGGSNVVVDVTAVGNELQTMNATVGNTITGIALDALPTTGRDVSTFLTLQPGISPDGSVAGAAVDQSYFSLDGGNNTNDMDSRALSVYTTSFAGDPTGGIANQSAGVAAGATGVMPTPADSVEEFQDNTANQTADFNSSAGAEVKVVTKRGTNAWHGTALRILSGQQLLGEYLGQQLQRCAGAQLSLQPLRRRRRRSAYLKEILGGKTYFFANYEGFRYPNTTTINKEVPSRQHAA